MDRHTVNALKKVVELIISGKELRILKHNGEEPINYPTSGWVYVPYPIEKHIEFNNDNLSTANCADFINSENFSFAEKEAESRWEKKYRKRKISWRLHIAIWAYMQAFQNTKGETIAVECGTGNGYMAAGIRAFIQKTNNKGLEKVPFYLIDKYTEGIETGENIVSHPADFAYAKNAEDVRKYFARYSSVRIIEGMLPDATEYIDSNKPISFLHMDLNSADAEMETLSKLGKRLCKGAIILFDDYGGPGGESQREVHNRFASDNNKNILILPTGQGLIMW